MTRIVHGTWIAVADGAKALILRNDGEVEHANFTVLDVFRNPKPESTAAQGTERPGRVWSGAGGRRSGVEQTDWHEIEEHRFARTVADVLKRHCDAGDFSRLVVVAPARALADLRKHFSVRVRNAIVAEIDKDLTKHPVYAMERILASL